MLNDIENIETSDFILNVYPNPVNDQLTIRINTEIKEDVDIQLYNSIGKVEFKKQWKLEKGGNYIYFYRDQLASGIYFLKVSSENSNLKVIKVIFK